MALSWYLKTFQWLLYSNLYIGLAAFGCLQVTRNTFPSSGHLPIGYDIALLFATISLYAFHRFVGIKRIPPDQLEGRFGIISKYREHLWYYGLITLAITVLATWITLEWKDILLLIPAGIISLLYITPIFPNSVRLRDLPVIKVFLIAMIWSWLCAGFPLMDTSLTNSAIMAFSIDRFLFVLAITLPFDIRDISVDRIEGTLTIPRLLGTRMTKYLSLLCLVMASVITIVLFRIQVVGLTYLLATVITYIASAFLVIKSKETNSDFYYSGWMDGLLILQWLLILVLSQFL